MVAPPGCAPWTSIFPYILWNDFIWIIEIYYPFPPSSIIFQLLCKNNNEREHMMYKALKYVYKWFAVLQSWIYIYNYPNQWLIRAVNTFKITSKGAYILLGVKACLPLIYCAIWLSFRTWVKAKLYRLWRRNLYGWRKEQFGWFVTIFKPWINMRWRPNFCHRTYFCHARNYS